MKFNALFKDLLQNGVLGTAVARILMLVEWQKRGLPHSQHSHQTDTSRTQSWRGSTDHDWIVRSNFQTIPPTPNSYTLCIPHVAWALWGP